LVLLTKTQKKQVSGKVLPIKNFLRLSAVWRWRDS